MRGVFNKKTNSKKPKKILGYRISKSYARIYHEAMDLESAIRAENTVGNKKPSKPRNNQ